MILRQKPPVRGAGRLSVVAKALVFLVLGYMCHSLLLGCWQDTEKRLSPVGPVGSEAAASLLAGSQADASTPKPTTSGAVLPDQGAATAAAGSTAAGAACPGGGPLTALDFVFAVASMCNRTSMMKGHRAWTQGMRSVVAVDCGPEEIAALNSEGAAHGEVYAFHRNIDKDELATTKISAGLGSLRAAMAPTMAHLGVGGGGYKWLLYGDDDTVFMMPPLIEQLKDLDPELPWLISDNAGWDGPFFARCVPCTFNDTGLDLQAALAYKTCKCDTTEAAAELDRRFGPFKRPPPWIRYGGPGQVASVGLMKMLNHDTFKACCVRRNPGCGGGDCTFSNCVNEQGITYSDLGWSIAHRRRFPGRVKNQFGLLDRGELAAYLKAGEAGTCDDQCKAELSGMASIHMNVKDFLPDRLAEGTAWIADTAERYNRYVTGALGLPGLAPGGGGAGC